MALEGEDGEPGTLTYTTTTAYVDAEHAITVTDPRGVVSKQTLDGLDRMIEQVVDTQGLAPAPPLNLTTAITYDGLGNKKEVTDPEDRTTSFDYDVLGRLRKTTDADSQETIYTYYGDGLKASEKDRRGVQKLFDYDNLGRPRKTRLAAAPFSGSPLEPGDAVRRRHAAQADRDRRAGQADDVRPGRSGPGGEGDGRTSGQYRTFTWDGVNKTSETDKRPAHHKTLLEYDGINRLKKTIDPSPFTTQTVELTYEDSLNRVTEKDRAGLLKRTQTDPLGRVLSVTRAAGTPDEASLEKNVYDGAGNKTLATDAEGKKTRFDYDAANRLEAREDGFESADANVTSFVYDKAGNVLEERDARAAALGEPWSVKRTYDELNRLETETDGETNVTQYGYDAEGNRTSVKTPKNQTTAFAYDELGKLTQVTQPSPGGSDPGR